MQHSKLMIKRVIKIIVFMTIFMILNGIFYFVYSPLAFKSEGVWARYSASENIDTIFVGTSIAETIDANISDEATGFHSLNMSTPSQYFKTSFDAIKLASKQHPLKRVFLFLGIDSLENYSSLSSDKSFNRALYACATPFQKLINYFRYNITYALDDENFTNTDSVNIFFSWVNDASASTNVLIRNMTYRLGKLFSGSIFTGNKINPDLVLYEMKDSTMNDDRKAALSQDIATAKNTFFYTNVSPKSLSYLDEICAYCQENGIELIVVMAPHNADYRENHSEYDAVNNFLSSFIVPRGGSYYNLDGDEAIRSRLTEDFFIDEEHISDDYIEESTAIVSNRLVELMNN